MDTAATKKRSVLDIVEAFYIFLRYPAGTMLRLALAPFLALWALAQDPYRLAPNNYKFEFENEWVRFSRVLYQPGDTIPEHDHPAVNTVYVYLTDGGEVRFGHKQFAAAKRPAVKAGAVRFAKANKETHDTAYLGDSPSEYFRVELRTKTSPYIRNERIAADSTVPIDNEQVRIERLSCARPCPAVTAPSVVVSIDDRSGRYLPPGATVPNANNLIRIVLKTPPMDKP